MPISVRHQLWGRWATRFEHFTPEQARRTASELRDVLNSSERSSFLILPTQTWFSSGFQRPQQLARALADLGHPVVYCEPWKNYKVLLTDETRRRRRFVGLKKIDSGTWLLRCPPEMLSELIEQGSPGAILLNWPNQAHLVAESLADRVVYDIIDDHSLFPNADDNWRRTHEYWLQRAAVLTATADDLIAQLKPVRPDVLLVPNGVRNEDWAITLQKECPSDLTSARKADIVVAYYGALAEWFDWDMWLGAARQRPNWSFVLIGYAYDGNQDAIRHRLDGLPNVQYLGPKAYQELPTYLTHVDVATIPFILNDVTHGCSPVKLFEYMAAGKPIVCSPMREVLKYRSLSFATTADEFVKSIEKVVARRDDPDHNALLRQEAAANTWRARAEVLSKAVVAARRNDTEPEAYPTLHSRSIPESPVPESSC